MDASPSIFTDDGCAHKKAGMMRVGDNPLRDLVAPPRIGVDTPIAKRMIRDALHRDRQIALLLMEGWGAIGNKVLQVAELWAVNRRIVHLGHNPSHRGYKRWLEAE